MTVFPFLLTTILDCASTLDDNSMATTMAAVVISFSNMLFIFPILNRPLPLQESTRGHPRMHAYTMSAYANSKS